jgi:hypothetical protein
MHRAAIIMLRAATIMLRAAIIMPCAAIIMLCAAIITLHAAIIMLYAAILLLWDAYAVLVLPALVPIPLIALSPCYPTWYMMYSMPFKDDMQPGMPGKDVTYPGVPVTVTMYPGTPLPPFALCHSLFLALFPRALAEQPFLWILYMHTPTGPLGM